MYFDRFDIVLAYYLFFCDYHEGQGSRKYARLAKMSGYWKPGHRSDYEHMNDNGREIYDSLVRKETTERNKDKG